MASTITEYNMRLEGIRFRAKHGVSDSERDLPQDFLVTVAVTLPVAQLAEADKVTEVFDYDWIATKVVEVGTQQSFKLLETLAQRVIHRLFEETPATKVAVSVTKTRPPTTNSVDAVSVEVVATKN
jgi:7,8-dihydroneopterin aldolase/epimerase/oxygenase